jgi:hypothetical protein
MHQIRHAALSHLGEKSVAAPLRMAKSRHRDQHILSRYVKPGVEAVDKLTAEHDSEAVLKSLNWHNTALKISSKCSFTPCKLRFLADFCLVLHAPE